MFLHANTDQTKTEFIQKIAIRFPLCDISTSYPHGLFRGRCPKSTRTPGSNQNGHECSLNRACHELIWPTATPTVDHQLSGT
jgi:hypothetical protein